MTINVPQRTGNYGPEENSNLGECLKRLSSTINTEACLLPDNTTGTPIFVPASLTPTVNLEIAFTDWTPGNILELDYQCVLLKTDPADEANPSILPGISIDGGVTWLALSGGGGAAVSSEFATSYSQPTGHVFIPVNVADVRIRLVYVSGEDLNLISATMCVKELDPDCVLATNGTTAAFAAPPIPVP